MERSVLILVAIGLIARLPMQLVPGQVTEVRDRAAPSR